MREQRRVPLTTGNRGRRARSWRVYAGGLVAAAAVICGAFATASLAAPGSATSRTVRVTALPFRADLIGITSPRAGLVPSSAGGVTVALKGDRSVRSVSVQINGRRVPGAAVRRRGSGRWTIRLRARDGLARGTNYVTVDAASRHAEGFASVVFRYASPARGLAQIITPAPGFRARSAPVAVILQAAQGVSVTAWLNGSRLRGNLTDVCGLACGRGPVFIPDLVGASDGLRYGDNLLVMRAYRAGRYQIVRRTFTVTRARPLPGAGLNRNGQTGIPLRLNGTQSRPMRRGMKLSYRWRILRAPPGSRAKLLGATTARPSLKPDVRGTYQVGLVVSARGRRRTASAAGSSSGLDKVTVTVTSDNPLLPLRAPVTQDGQVGIELGGQFIAGVQGVPVQAFAFVRGTATLEPATGGVSATAGFSDMTQIGGWITQMQQTYGTPLIVIQTVAGQRVTAGGASDFNAAIAQIGAAAAWQPTWNTPPAPFATVGVPGMAPGEAKQTCGAFPQNSTGSCALSGYLALDSDQYGFVWGDYVPFQTKPADTKNGLTNTMSVNGNQIASSPPPVGAEGGYQVVTIDRYDLAVRSNNSYWTNSSLPFQVNDEAIASMGQALTAASEDPTELVLIASLGHPRPQRLGPFSTYNTILLPAIDALGGNRDVFIGRRAGAYSLVGAGGNIDGAIEASDTAAPAGEQADPCGCIEGMLARNNQELFQPSIAAPGAPNFELLHIAYQPQVPWPHSSDPGYAQASKWFAEQLLGPQHVNATNVRDVYDTDDTLSADTVKDLQYPSDANFPRQTFDDLQRDYEAEFPAVAQVHKFLTGTSAKFKEPFIESQLGVLAQLQKISTDVQNAVNPPSSASVHFDVLGFLSGMLGLGTVFAPEVAVPAEALSAALGSAGDTSTTQDGTLTTQVQTTAGNLASAFATALAATLSGFDTLDDIIVHDHDKLIAASELFGSLNWQDDQTPGAVEQLILAGARQAVYAALMPLVWSSTGKNPSTYFSDPASNRTDIRQWSCTAPDQLTIHPYGNLPASAEYAFEAGLDANGNPLHSVWWWVHAGGPGTIFSTPPPGAENCADSTDFYPQHWKTPDIPPASLTDPLFAAAGSYVKTSPQTPGVGLFAPWFWQRNFQASCWRDKDTRCSPLPDMQAPAPAWRQGN